MGIQQRLEAMSERPLAIGGAVTLLVTSLAAAAQIALAVLEMAP